MPRGCGRCHGVAGVGGVVVGRGCVVAGQGYCLDWVATRASRFHGRFTSHQWQQPSFTRVSRAARTGGQVSRVGGGLTPSLRTLTRYSECGQPRPRTEQRVRLRNSGLVFRMTSPGHHPSGAAATSHATELGYRRPRQGIRLTPMLS